MQQAGTNLIDEELASIYILRIAAEELQQETQDLKHT